MDEVTIIILIDKKVIAVSVPKAKLRDILSTLQTPVTSDSNTLKFNVTDATKVDTTLLS